MDRHVQVYVELLGKPHLVGRLWARMRKDKETATFEYDPSWLARPDRFALEPALSLDPGPFHTSINKTVFGSLGDSAPDRWGRGLMRRAERKRAASEGRTPRTLHEVEFLLMVDDESRQGALRFSETEGRPFLAPQGATRIPPLIELSKLLSAANNVIDDTDSDDDLKLLLAPGSSLGGARPKASVRDKNGQLAIAKFPHKEDRINQVLWEALALSLAAKAGIAVPDWSLEHIGEHSVLLLRRFDRSGSNRIPFLSAMSMLGGQDGEHHSYLEIADALRKFGGQPKADLQSLWRRIVFSILISNTDDHLRNHGFLYEGGQGWRLSPAYDLNPVPVDIKPRILTTAIDEDDGTASLDLAFSVSEYFELDKSESKAIAGEVGRTVVEWRKNAAEMGLAMKEINRMESAFEHRDLEAALKLSRI